MPLDESKTLAFDSTQPEPQMQPPPGNMGSSTALLGKQNSILSLTLDEIQLKSGKNFGSMNMDEFLANLWTVEENQVPREEDKTAEIRQSGLAREGSFSIPVPLCKKTVDEVWFQIQKGITQGEDTEPSDDRNAEDIQREQTLGEITLEDFLVKAGVVQDPSRTNLVGSTLEPANMGLGMVGACAFNDHNTTICSIFNRGKNFVGESSRNAVENERVNSFLPDFDGFRIKKRIIDGPPEVLLERRQRRMIKNRESAARSRARKQAYTVELELELTQLTEENKKLKQILEENEKKRKQEVMKRNQQITTQKNLEKLRRIRRMVSVGW